MNLIFKFDPYLKPVIWGGNKIAALKGVACVDENIGESWEISGVEGHESVVANGDDRGMLLSDLIDKYGEDILGKRVLAEHGNHFPLLIKIIDAAKDLSIQVHPGEELARSRHNSPGKAELWYVVATEPGAKIYAGLVKEIDPESYDSVIADNSIMDALASHTSSPGDIYFLPAGRIHAIGTGNLLVEVQPTCDITYRIYDYNRLDSNGKPRELHPELAKDAIDYTIYESYTHPYDKSSEGRIDIADCQYFKVAKLTVRDSLEFEKDDSFVTFTCVEGSCTIEADDENTSLKAGETCLVAAATRSIKIIGTATLIAAQP